MISWMTLAGWGKAILGFGLMILVHEMGHLLALKWRGFPVFAFSLGFGRPWCRLRWQETEYRLGWLPLGGYVLAEDPDAPTAVARQSPPPRDQFLVALAGPLANFLLAWVLYLGLIGGVGLPEPIPVVASVLKHGPGADAGLHAGDRVLEMNGVRVRTWDEFVRLIQINGARPARVTVEREGVRQDLTVTPQAEGGRCVVGVVPVQAPRQPVPWSRAAGLALERTIAEIGQVVVGLFGMLFAARGGEVAGPLAIIDHISQAAVSWWAFLILLAILSINLGVFNLLPIPPLDGIRLVLALIQAVRRRPLEERILLPIYQWGTVGLGLVFLLVTLKDLAGFF